MATKISDACANTMLAAMGGVVRGGAIKAYSGSVPATVTTALSSQVKLWEDNLATPAYTGITNHVMTMDHSVLSAAAIADGTAAFYRVETSLGVAVWQGTIGLSGSGANLIVDSVDFTTGGIVTVLGWTVTLPLG